MANLPSSVVEQIRGVFAILGENENTLDALHLGDALRVLDLNPSLTLIEKMGGTKKKGEKKISFDEFLPIYEQVKNDKDNGVYEDFIELCKLYDKAENGLVLVADIHHALLSLGEKLTEKEYEEVTKDCMDEEDDDGCIPYIPFLARMCGRPVPTSIVPT